MGAAGAAAGAKMAHPPVVMVMSLCKKNGATLQAIPIGKPAVDAIVLAELRCSALSTAIG